MNIKGSVVFVTGANRGLGLAFAREALARGASKVYAGMRDTKGFNEPGLVPVQIDVTNADSVAAAAAKCTDLTVLINNAGIGGVVSDPLDNEIDAVSRRVFETNYYGVIRVTQAFAPILAKSGYSAIINVLSNASWLPILFLTPYSASKSAAWSFTNHSRLHLKRQNTQVLGLLVGFIDTDLTKALDVPKSSPQHVVRQTYDALELGKDEIMADEGTRALKRSLGGEVPAYIDPARAG